MSKRIFPTLLALVLAFCLAVVLLPSAAAEEPEAVWIDISDQVLQAGGLLPEPAPRLRATRGDPYAAVKTEIYDALAAWQSEVNIQTYNVPLSDIWNVFGEVLNENPDLFYVDQGNVRAWYGSNNTVSKLTLAYVSTYTEADVTAYRETVQRIVGMLGPDWSDVEKLLFLHDYLVTHCEYDLSYSRYNAHDALVVGSSVCQGYALAFNDLCRKGGISSQVISSRAIDHAWNLVAVDGEFCYVDCTWDDPSNNWYEGRCGHDYFLLGRDAFYANKHNCTDWTNGTVNVYDTATTSRYDSEWWQGVVTAVPRIGHIGAYTLKDNAGSIYLRDLSSGSVTTLSLPSGSARWPVWNGSGSWVGNFSSAAALNGLFYFTLPTEIWTLSPSREMSRAYSLTSDERAQGYLYGIVNDRNTLYYSLGTQASDTSFARVALETGPVTGECDGFTYLVLPDGTASITACARTGDVVIPDTLDGYTVTNLASQLFYGKSGVTSVAIPATVTSFGEDPEDNNRDNVFSYCGNLTRIDVDENNPVFCSEDGVLFTKNKTRLINYPCNRAGEVYHTEAACFCCTAFASCRNLKFLFIDDPDTTWYTNTFSDTPALTAFYLPGGETAIQVAAERRAGHVQDGTPQNTWCALVEADAIRNLPADLTLIEAEAFRGTDIPYLVAPAGCVRIEADAFVDTGLRYLRVGANTVIESGALPVSAVVERVS